MTLRYMEVPGGGCLLCMGGAGEQEEGMEEHIWEEQENRGGGGEQGEVLGVAYMYKWSILMYIEYIL